MPATFDLVSCAGLLHLSQLMRSRSYSKIANPKLKRYVEMYLSLTAGCYVDQKTSQPGYCWSRDERVIS